MGSCSERDKDSIFSPKTTSFFKIICEDSIIKKKLLIPRSFLRKHGNGLLSSVTLQVPSGETWQIELSKCDAEVWLQKGWREFAEYYSLEFGSFLIFRYQGHCHFYVIIFDKSTSEIEYPCRSISSFGQKDVGEMQELERDENEDARHDLSPKRNIGEHSPWHQSCKIIRNGSTNSTSNPLFRASAGNFSSQHTPSSNINVETSHCSKRKFGGKHKQMTCKGNDSQAPGAANKFFTKHPSFTSAVWLSTLKATRVSIPKCFSHKYFEVGSMIVTLQVADRLWPVKLIRHSSWISGAKFCAGWAAFSRDNSLEVGDVCFFELIKSDLLNVSITKP